MKTKTKTKPVCPVCGKPAESVRYYKTDKSPFGSAVHEYRTRYVFGVPIREVVRSCFLPPKGQPPKPLPYRSYEIRNTGKEARANAPYKEGDIFLTNFGGIDSTVPPDVRVCRVCYVGSTFLITASGAIPVYDVVFWTKRGGWSRRERRTYPAEIYSAYHQKEVKE